MIRLLNSDVTKLLAYFVSCFLLAALMTPWIYNAGMFLSEVTSPEPGGGFLGWLGGKAADAEFTRFFKRSLLFSALVLLVPLALSLRLSNRPASLRNSPWSLYLPPRAIASAQGQRLRNPPLGWLQLITGFLLAGGILFGMGLFLVSMGWFHWVDDVDWAKSVKRSIPDAAKASLLEEFLFRGVLLGIFLRSFRPFWAIALLAILFSALHFLQPTDDLAIFDRALPVPEGMVFIDPESSLAGFELLRLIGLRFLDPLPFLHEFITLAVVGVILGYARFATSSLWLPIGLHAGWIFAFRLFGKVTDLSDIDPKLEIYVGHNLKDGLIPLAALILTGILVTVYTRTLRLAPSVEPPASPELRDI